MLRRFVNVVAENYKGGVYSLHRIDVSKHLFHQSRADARVVPPFLAGSQEVRSCDEQPMLLDGLKELPAPCVQIHPSFREDPVLNKLPFLGFLSPRSSEDKFLCMNCNGNTMFCCADKPSVEPMPHLQGEVEMDPISFSVVRPDAQDQDQEEEEDLYVIHDVPHRRWAGANIRNCFGVFRKDADGYRWESLPPPPPIIGASRRDAPALSMYAYTVVDGGRTICFSCASPGISTYCFNTVEREWRHAGAWLLPFVGRAEYVPDLALWLGFTPCGPSYYLCGTLDLDAAMATKDQPPKLQYVWQDLVTPENWSPGWARLVSLGSGRFCIAKAFVVENRRVGKSGDEWWELVGEVTVLTGIEVARDDDDERLIKIWRHKSMKYSSKYNIMGVL